MSNMVLQCKETSDFKPHPEGIHPAVCVDVMDLGLVETEFQGQRRMVNKVKIAFESEAKTEDGKACMVSKNFTASLHPKAKLAEFLGKWRGRPVVPGETIELAKLIGASCTLVISHQQNLVGKTYANIDAISKPTRKVSPSGTYDPAAARQRYAEWKARQGRPRCSARHVFVRLNAPHREFACPSDISTIVRQAMDRAGLHPPCRGAHVLRHSLATHMLQRGASLAEIGELLRHRAPTSTEHYSKVALDALCALAQPWPEGL